MRKQLAFASLTEAEIEKIAGWLRHETYEVVLERVRKPRPEGFGLDISKRPLETLYAKSNRVERINNRIASGQRLTLAEFDAIQAGEKADLAEQIHDAIMDETHAMATSGENTPTQLLALQRLADFPARAEYRQHRLELDLRKEERDQEKHAHKVQMDLQKSAHKIQMNLEKAAQKKEMDEHRKLMAEDRLALAKRSLDLRETQLAARAAEKESAIRNPQSAISDDLGPLASTLDEIEARATRKFNLPPIAANSSPINTGVGPGESPNATNEGTVSTVSPQLAVSENPHSAILDPQCHNPSAVKNSPVSPQPSLNGLPIQSSNNPSILSMTGPSAPSVVKMDSLEDRVSAYTLARHYEAAHGKNPRIVGKYAAWNFKTKMQWCPCGNQQLPCPDHGDFPKYFWEISPDSADFTAVLRAKKLPFIPHYQLLREQEEEQRRQQEAAEQPIPLSPSLPPLPLSETLSETLSSSSQENTEDSRTDADLQSGDDNEKARIDQAVSLTPEPSHEVARQPCCSDFQSGVTTEPNETTASAVFEPTDNEQPTSDQSNKLITDHWSLITDNQPKIHESKYPPIQAPE